MTDPRAPDGPANRPPDRPPSRRAVFLDRDGVVNEVRLEGGVALAPRGPDDVAVPPDVPGALRRLREAGYVLVLVTNQPEVARGTTTVETVDAINSLLQRELGLDAVYSCLHDNSDDCDCRKPRPGMLRRAAADLDLDLTTSWLVGDRWVDIGAADGAGVRSVLLERPYSWVATSSGGPPTTLEPSACADSLSAATDRILAAT